VFQQLSLREPSEKEQVVSVRVTRLLDEHLELAVVSSISTHVRPPGMRDRREPKASRDTIALHHGCLGPVGPDTDVSGMAST
jgi:hypothetical protein